MQFGQFSVMIRFSDCALFRRGKGPNAMNSAEELWSRVLDMLKTDLTSTAIETWFTDCRALDANDSTLIISCPAEFKKNVIESRFLPFIRDSLREIFSGDFDVKILSAEEAENYQSCVSDEPTNIYDSFTFDRFVVGKSNMMAHSAAKAVADGLATEYNPLFIYGNSGLGKTHLLHAIRLRVRERHPDYNIVYVKGDDFTNELIYAIQTGKNFEFREKYRYADLFLMDDIQFIAGKIQTQEEFFHTFNTLFEDGHQIVFTSDRPPSEISKLEDRLRTRFESGLIVDIQPPDYETRVAIIRNKATQIGVILNDDIIDYIAQNITANVRQLDGAVKKIKAYHELMDAPITTDMAEQVLESFYKDNAEAPTPDMIIEETAKYYNLTSEDLKGNSHVKNFVTARHVSMYIIRQLTNLSLSEIGGIFGGKDHTTVLSACRKIEKDCKQDVDLSNTVRDITSNINSKN